MPVIASAVSENERISANSIRMLPVYVSIWRQKPHRIPEVIARVRGPAAPAFCIDNHLQSTPASRVAR